MEHVNTVDSHHKVLAAWAQYRCTLNQAPRLITLDHHTDTSKPFRRFINKTNGKGLSTDKFNGLQNSLLKKINFKDSTTITEAIGKLNNDEHIVASIKTDIISSAFVVAHSAANTDLDTYKQHSIACHSVDEIMINNKLSLKHDIVLESSFLDEALNAFNEILSEAKEDELFSQPYILDIDLDYFNTFKSINPDSPEMFINLIKNAGLITIATEPEYVKHCAIDEGLTSEYLLQKLHSFF